MAVPLVLQVVEDHLLPGVVHLVEKGATKEVEKEIDPKKRPKVKKKAQMGTRRAERVVKVGREAKAKEEARVTKMAKEKAENVERTACERLTSWSSIFV